VRLEKADVERITSYLDLSTVLPERSDLAIVFGTMHPEPARMAADLVKRGLVRYVVLTGGWNRHTGVHEARAHLRRMLSTGVQRDRIVVEDRSSNTLENAIYALPAVAARLDLEAVRAVVAVVKWYHGCRALMTLKRHWPAGIRYFLSPYEPDGVARSDWWQSEGGRRRVLKEWANIPKYLERGDITAIQQDGAGFV
jgi:hypothetical protein